MSGWLVDSHGTRHAYRDADLAGAALCGYPPVGVKLTDPPPNMSPSAPYKRVCISCSSDALSRRRDVMEEPVSVKTFRPKSHVLEATWDELLEPEEEPEEW